ncbi:hypothetical protein CAPTEDRAFT_191989 [Capitella teleta]|uniref:Sulfotransferase domain-containing protein n=1 Tax=Capitella teleta TaxID=283909 RepID=R7TAR4_CAPTE|nr:hypothetical protein CAPTEDRAFT_191989 [Capitella teleta]|eukprot:ELT90602.1 hypothetical protein CAPTEDRAFT_191989 [Capitella teleta]
MQLGQSKPQSPASSPVAPGIHKEHHAQVRKCFPAFFSGEVLPSFGEYKDKPLSHRVEGFATQVFGFGVWDTLSEVCDARSMSPMKCLKVLFKIIIVLSIIVGIANWAFQSSNDSGPSALARNLAVLHPSYKGPVFLHLLSSQNTGSEYIGKIMDLYQDSFYIHDPLELVYTTVFGITANSDRILPNNVFFDAAGEFRNMSRAEHGLDLWTMDKMFHCRMTELPTAMLTNPYWSTYASKQMVNTVQYVTCLGKHGVRMDQGHESFRECHKHIQDPICPKAFSTKPKGDRCASVLFRNETFTTQDSDDLWQWPDGNHPMLKYRRNFQRYFQCIAKLEEPARKCAGWHLDGVCKNKQFRVIKTSRVTMDVAEKMLQNFPNYRVIHLFRDPRGVAFSRLQSASPFAFAPFESPDAGSLAKSYCKILYTDKITRIRLQHIYFDRVIGIFFDKFTRDVATNMEWLLMHVNLKMSKSKVSLDYAEKAKEMMVLEKDRWRNGLDAKGIKQVQRECSKLMRGMQLCMAGRRCVEYSMED